MEQTQYARLTSVRSDLLENTPYSAQFEIGEKEGLPNVGGQPVATRRFVKRAANGGPQVTVCKCSHR